MGSRKTEDDCEGKRVRVSFNQIFIADDVKFETIRKTNTDKLIYETHECYNIYIYIRRWPCNTISYLIEKKLYLYYFREFSRVGRRLNGLGTQNNYESR